MIILHMIIVKVLRTEQTPAVNDSDLGSAREREANSTGTTGSFPLMIFV